MIFMLHKTRERVKCNRQYDAIYLSRKDKHFVKLFLKADMKTTVQDFKNTVMFTLSKLGNHSFLSRGQTSPREKRF